MYMYFAPAILAMLFSGDDCNTNSCCTCKLVAEKVSKLKLGKFRFFQEHIHLTGGNFRLDVSTVKIIPIRNPVGSSLIRQSLSH